MAAVLLLGLLFAFAATLFLIGAAFFQVAFVNAPCLPGAGAVSLPVELARGDVRGSTARRAAPSFAVAPTCPGSHSRMIGVSPPEALTIAARLTSDHPRSEVERVQKMAQWNAAKVATMDRAQYALANIPCPLMGTDGRCVAADCRPVQCKAWTLGATDGLPATGGPASQATGPSQKLDGALYELNHALTIALEQPDATERWATGRRVFEGCKRYA